VVNNSVNGGHVPDGHATGRAARPRRRPRAYHPV